VLLEVWKALAETLILWITLTAHAEQMRGTEIGGLWIWWLRFIRESGEVLNVFSDLRH